MHHSIKWVTLLPVFLCGVAVILNLQPASAQNNLEAVRQQFVGSYELIGFVSIDEDGQEVDREYVGRIMYDEYGNMAAQGMPADLPDRARDAAENVQAGFAYWGSVTFDLDRGIVIHHVQGSPTRGSWPGSDNVRYFELRDDLLILSVKNSEGRTTARLTWRKFK